MFGVILAHCVDCYMYRYNLLGFLDAIILAYGIYGVWIGAKLFLIGPGNRQIGPGSSSAIPTDFPVQFLKG